MPFGFDFTSLSRRTSWSRGKPLHYSLVAVLVAVGCLTASVPTWINVTITIHDDDAAAPPNSYVIRSDDYNGSFQASYTTSSSKNTSLRSQLDASAGSWILYLGGQTLRKLMVALSSQGGPSPDSLYSDNVELAGTCFDANNQPIGILSIPPNPPNNSYNSCSLTLDFSTYKLVMGPNRPGTGFVSVYCNAGDGQGKCNSWTIMPNPNTGNLANLYQNTKKGQVLVGSYHNTFRIDITNQP